MWLSEIKIVLIVDRVALDASCNVRHQELLLDVSALVVVDKILQVVLFIVLTHYACQPVVAIRLSRDMYFSKMTISLRDICRLYVQTSEIFIFYSLAQMPLLLKRGYYSDTLGSII